MVATAVRQSQMTPLCDLNDKSLTGHDITGQATVYTQVFLSGSRNF